ncbi:MAG: DUF4157 domain-containing protein [Actinomycetales bacterium]|nr:DUF4157 domain-containing protein [Actinomycetales bacterium]
MSSETASRITGSRGGGEPLPDGVRSPLERQLGTELGGVHVHADAEAAALAESVEAGAFTTGRDVFFGAGQYRPETRDGRELIAHETVHVAQDGAGRLRRSGRVSEPADPAEVEARRLAPGLAAGIEDGTAVHRSDDGPGGAGRHARDEAGGREATQRRDGAGPAVPEPVRLGHRRLRAGGVLMGMRWQLPPGEAGERALQETTTIDLGWAQQGRLTALGIDQAAGVEFGWLWNSPSDWALRLVQWAEGYQGEPLTT